MKRLMTIVFALVTLLSCVGCNQSQLSVQPTTQSTKEPMNPSIPAEPKEFEDIFDYVIEEDDKCYLLLPASGQRISVSDSEKPYLDKVDLDMLVAAEDKLNTQLAQGGEKLAFFLLVENNKLWLCAEMIVKIDPPKSEGAGCGIDHEHIFIEEPITE